MIFALGLLAGFGVAWALGADLSRLATVRMRGTPLVIVALAIQIVVFTSLNTIIATNMDTSLHVLSYALIIGFFLLNVRLPGFWLVGFGVFANALVITLNHGRMPVSLAAWQGSGGDPREITVTGENANNVLAGPHSHLPWLGDVLSLPHGVPFATAISIGDMLTLLGLIAFVYRVCTPSSIGRTTNLFAPLRADAFRRVLAGRFVSGTGDWLSQAALVTWIYASTHSTYLVAAFLVSRIVSGILGGVASAPLLDRTSGFRLLSGVEALRGVLTLSLLPLAVSGQIWPVVCISASSSFLSAATSPTASSLIPDVLPTNLLQAGNALHNLAPTLSSILGAAAGGFLVIHYGIGAALAVDVATFVAAALLYHAFAGRTTPIAGENTPLKSRRALAYGALESRVVLAVIASFTFATAAFGMLNAITPTLFEHRFQASGVYGYVAATLGIGYLCGELLTGLIQRHSVVHRSLGVAFFCTALAALLFADSPTIQTAFLAAFMLGATDGVTEVAHDTLIQLHTRSGTRGGVFAIATSVERAGMLAGLIIAPMIVSLSSPQTAARCSAALLLVAAVIAAASVFQPRRASTEQMSMLDY